EFRGYVECVEGTTFVRTQYCDRTELFKFYVNNGKGRRMKILSWGVNAVKWSPQISERSKTDIKFEAEKFLEETTDADENPDPDIVLIQDVANVESNKKIRVIGWIKVPFQLVTFGGGSRGSGVIVDHEWKIRVHIRVFQAKPELVKGMKVSINCEYNSTEGCVLSCQSMSQINSIISEPILSEDDLNNMGFYTPKRKSDDDLPHPTKKRSPFDC
ncbi:hypothetical protein G9C98_007339, partial [Cotesia typhae]